MYAYNKAYGREVSASLGQTKPACRRLASPHAAARPRLTAALPEARGSARGVVCRRSTYHAEVVHCVVGAEAKQAEIVWPSKAGRRP